MRLLLGVADGLILMTAAIHAVLALRFAEAGFIVDWLQFAGAAAGYVVIAALLTGDEARRTMWTWIGVGYTAVVIGLWVAIGQRTALAYADKAIELVLIGVLLVLWWAGRRKAQRVQVTRAHEAG